jgi:hypothetical protein
MVVLVICRLRIQVAWSEVFVAVLCYQLSVPYFLASMSKINDDAPKNKKGIAVT